MENPATWKMADKIITEAYEEWAQKHDSGAIGASVGRFIADRLRHHGYISDSDEPAIDWKGLRSPSTSRDVTPVTDKAALAGLDAWFTGFTGKPWDGKGGRGTLCLMKDAIAASRNPPEPEPGRMP